MSANRTAIVLAGGRSSRFGSNKALQTLAGKALIRYVTDRVSNAVDELIVVIGHRESAAEYQAVLPNSVRVMNDDREGKNPLIGIVTGLQAAASEYAAILSCDTPFVRASVIDFLFRRALNADAAIPKWDAGRIEPLQAAYQRVAALRASQEVLSDKDASHKEMISRLVRVAYVSVEREIKGIDSSLNTFFNINTREDLSVAERMLADRRQLPENG
jgi:molybdopterin-guanine dinucleotide biosynthesis protein A